MRTETGYGKLLADTRFEAFLWTQFLGAFNDNVYKMIVSIMAVHVAVGSHLSSRYLAIAGAVFVLPFLLFAGYAGQLADRFSKTRVLQVTKAFEILIMLMGIAALLAGRIEPLLAVLFLLAVHSNFFSPAKYGILPEMMGEEQISRANGLLELSTFVAIVVGTSFGTFLFDHWRHLPLRMGLTLLAIAVAGALASLHIKKVPAAGSTEPFHGNPFREIVSGARDLMARKSLMLSVAGISWFWFVGALFQLSLILAGSEVLHVPDRQVGFLVTALAVGIGLGSVIAGALSGDHIELGLVPVGSILMGLFSIGFGLNHSYAWALVWLAGVGFAGGLFAVPLNAFLQERAGASEKGRVLATNNFANMLGVILASGVLWCLHWNAGWIIFALGIVIVAGTTYVVSVLPDLSIRFVLWCVATVLFRVRVEGGERIPRQSAALLVANHVSFADAVLIGYTTPRIVRFLMWGPYYNHPAARMFFRALHAIPISAQSPKETVRAIHRAQEELRSGELVGIFPEGHISLDGEMRKFERGFERIVNGAAVPIIPIHIEGMFGHPLSYKGGGLFRSWERVFRPAVTVRVGEPIHGDISPEELRGLISGLAGGRN
jgi:1-acyl-sn-glycerol-3-phosphate acyltransferase